MVGVKYIASVSFGKDSLAMLLRLIEEKKPLDYVVFYNTGMEFQSIYNLRDQLIPVIKRNGIQFIELSPDEPFIYSMLEKPVKFRNGSGYHYGFSWCGGACRWGTGQKLRAIQKFKSSIGEPVCDYVGIAADEPNRFEKALSSGKILPLVDWKMTEADCLAYCRQRGYTWTEPTLVQGVERIDLYDILDRVSCWCCANKNRNELFNIWRFLPQYFDKLKELQSKTYLPMKKYRNRKYGSYGNVFDMEHVFQQEHREVGTDA